jgi:hypothetical protein
MFEDMLKNKVKADLIFLDGGLTRRRRSAISRDCPRQHELLVLDDFEGVEKRVSPTRKCSSYEGAMLVYPRRKRTVGKARAAR